MKITEFIKKRLAKRKSDKAERKFVNSFVNQRNAIETAENLIDFMKADNWDFHEDHAHKKLDKGQLIIHFKDDEHTLYVYNTDESVAADDIIECRNFIDSFLRARTIIKRHNG